MRLNFLLLLCISCLLPFVRGGFNEPIVNDGARRALLPPPQPPRAGPKVVVDDVGRQPPSPARAGPKVVVDDVARQPPSPARAGPKVVVDDVTRKAKGKKRTKNITKKKSKGKKNKKGEDDDDNGIGKEEYLEVGQQRMVLVKRPDSFWNAEKTCIRAYHGRLLYLTNLEDLREVVASLKKKVGVLSAPAWTGVLFKKIVRDKKIVGYSASWLVKDLGKQSQDYVFDSLEYRKPKTAIAKALKRKTKRMNRSKRQHCLYVDFRRVEFKIRKCRSKILFVCKI